MTIPLPEDSPAEVRLAMPTGATPVVPPHLISPTNPHGNSVFADRVWALSPLIDTPGIPRLNINWDRCQPPFTSQLKLLTWTMINGYLPQSVLAARGPSARSRRSAPQMAGHVGEWLFLVRMLHARGHRRLDALDDSLWARHLADRSHDKAPGAQGKLAVILADLWAYDQIAPHPVGVPRPPWADTPQPDSRGPAGENATEPFDPAVIEPLLAWALRFVEDFRDDILSAAAEMRRLRTTAQAAPATKSGLTALHGYVNDRVRTGQPLPTWGDCRHPRSLATTYIAAITGAGLHQTENFARRHNLHAYARSHPGATPLTTPVNGRLAGRPWLEHIDYTEALDLERHLATAATIVCLYLTGMRPQEVQGMRSGCCPDPEKGPHLIRAHHYKTVRDADGNHVSAGELRNVPWTAITPVVTAIRTLEAMVPPGELLLSTARHSTVHNPIGSLTNSAVHGRLRDFRTWVNANADRLGLPDQTIPDDPHGGLAPARFRRTLAWHIARRPGGLIALAIQYGHMRTVLDARTSSSYASRTRNGIHSVLDVETALAAADTAAHLRDRAAAGERISGPAARRALAAAATTPRFEGHIVPNTFARKAAAFLARDGLVLFDNPEAMLICAFKRDTALCEPGPDAVVPRQWDCRPGCGNAVRTDAHASAMRARADELDHLANVSPGPLGRRLRANAARLRQAADAHDATAPTPGGST
ncbi:integrase [Streptomyces lavendulocolor]|uniref:integrase n=1 Tax=Streptomyces lavendulocolor TaxID=67316 RepID=UPI0031CE2593